MEKLSFEKINKNYIPIAINEAINSNNSKITFILYAENWNDYDNDHYILSSSIGSIVSFNKLETIDEINSLAQKISGDHTNIFFSKDLDGEIQGDIYGKVIR